MEKTARIKKKKLNDEKSKNRIPKKFEMQTEFITH